MRLSTAQRVNSGPQTRSNFVAANRAMAVSKGLCTILLSGMLLCGGTSCQPSPSTPADQAVRGMDSNTNPQASDEVTVVSETMHAVLQEIYGAEVAWFHPQVVAEQTLEREGVRRIQNSRLIVLDGTHQAGWVDTVSLPQSKVRDSTFDVLGELIVVADLGSHSHGSAGSHSHSGIVPQTWLDPILFGKQLDTVSQDLVAVQLISDAQKQAAMANWETIATPLNVRLESLRSPEPLPVLADAAGAEYLGRRLNWEIQVQDLRKAAKTDSGNLKTELQRWVDQHPTGIVLLPQPDVAALETMIAEVTPRILRLDLIESRLQPGQTKPFGGNQADVAGSDTRSRTAAGDDRQEGSEPSAANSGQSQKPGGDYRSRMEDNLRQIEKLQRSDSE